MYLLRFATAFYEHLHLRVLVLLYIWTSKIKIILQTIVTDVWGWGWLGWVNCARIILYTFNIIFNSAQSLNRMHKWRKHAKQKYSYAVDRYPGGENLIASTMKTVSETFCFDQSIYSIWDMRLGIGHRIGYWGPWVYSYTVQYTHTVQYTVIMYTLYILRMIILQWQQWKC